jgi:hypothetical protein
MAKAAFIERQNRVRGALHCYLRIAISNLPAFSDFPSMFPIGSELLYDGLNDIDTFDAQNLDIVSTASGLLDCFKDWTKALRINNYPREENFTMEDDKKEAYHHFINEIFSGSIFHSILLKTIELLEGYDSSLQRVREAFVGLEGPDSEDRFYMASTKSKRIQGDLRRHLDKLERDPKNLDLIKQAGISVGHANELLPRAAGGICAECFEKILSTADSTEPPSEVPEEPQTMGDFKDYENED